MRLLIARNAEVRKPGGALTDAGISQARKLGIRLKDEPLDVIFSSNLQLEQETAGRVGLYHDDALIMGRKYLGSENDLEESELMQEAKSIIAGAQNYKNVLMVTETKQYHALMADILGISYDKVKEMGEVENTALTIFDPFPEMQKYACIEHLNGVTFIK